MAHYRVCEDNQRDQIEEPEKVLAIWFGQNWKQKLDQLTPLPSGNVYTLNKPAKKLRIYRI